MDISPDPHPFAAILPGALRLIWGIGLFAIPLGWLLAGVAVWRRLPRSFAILSHWLVGLLALMAALVALGSGGFEVGLFAACLSGALAWIFVGRRSRREANPPSLL